MSDWVVGPGPLFEHVGDERVTGWRAQARSLNTWTTTTTTTTTTPDDDDDDDDDTTGTAMLELLVIGGFP